MTLQGDQRGSGSATVPCVSYWGSWCSWWWQPGPTHDPVWIRTLTSCRINVYSGIYPGVTLRQVQPHETFHVFIMYLVVLMLLLSYYCLITAFLALCCYARHDYFC